MLYKPKDIVSGDFYWFTQFENLKIFVVADCTGHGVPGAFMSMIGNTLLNQIVVERKILRPDLILNELRKEIIKSLKSFYTLNLNTIISPSCTIYSFPSIRAFPFSRAPDHPPNSTRSFQFTVSALINFF